MLDTLIAYDQSLFMFLNSTLANSFFDWFMPFITNAKTWMPVILLVWLYLLYRGDRQMRVLAVALLVSVGLTDLFCARILKKSVGRIRPCSLEQTENFRCRLLLPKKGSKSFPSNHAANTSAFAATVILFWGLKTGFLFGLLAFIVGYSRIYCGVHFPLDVLTGWFVGATIAWLVWMLAKKYRFYINEESDDDSSTRKLAEQTSSAAGDHFDA
jgi:undecaprenyl-diphosphatase